MSGVIGLDPQRSRTALALRATGGTAGGPTRLSKVGDGRRLLVPNATGDAGAWGSAALDAWVSTLSPGQPAAIEVAERWLADPWSPEFLRGARDRLVEYLGRVTPTHRNGYHVCVVAADGAEAAHRCAAGGLDSVNAVRPADALLCRWLAEAAPLDPVRGLVVAVACGETSTSVEAYQVSGEDRPKVSSVRGSAGQVESAAADWVAQLAGMVLERCREAPPAAAVPAVLDGVLEFGAFLRSRPPDASVEWTGPLCDRLFAPLRLRRADLAEHPATRESADAVAGLVSAAGELASGSGDRDGPLVLVGGFGAIGPFMADALRPHGRVRQSPEPEWDLAVGAAWWPALRHLFTGPDADTAEPTARPGPQSRALAATAAVPAPGGLVPTDSTSGHADRPAPWAVPAASADDVVTPPWLAQPAGTLETGGASDRSGQTGELPPWKTDSASPPWARDDQNADSAPPPWARDEEDRP